MKWKVIVKVARTIEWRKYDICQQIKRRFMDFNGEKH